MVCAGTIAARARAARPVRRRRRVPCRPRRQDARRARARPCRSPSAGTPAELEALAGQDVVRIARVGKFLDLDLDRDRVVVNPMLTGRFQLAAQGEKAPAGTAVELDVRARDVADRRPTPRRGPPARRWMPARRRAGRSSATRTRPRWARSTCCPRAWSGRCRAAATGEMGPDALDPALTLEVWRDRIRKHPGELKNLLRNQAFVAGIGNAYSDEILCAARLQPFRKRVDARGRGGRRAVRGDALDAARASIELLRRARPADVREAGPRPPRGPQPRRRGVPALRDEDHGREGRRVPDRVLPGLPALTPAQGTRDDQAPGRTLSARGSVMSLSRLELLHRRAVARGDALSVSPDLTL